MTTKEKLDLLWKYILLIVLIWGIASMGRRQDVKCIGMGHGMGHGKAMWMSGDHDFHFKGGDMKDVQVMIEKLGDGDSTMVITVNGEVVDLDEVNWKDIHGLEDLDIDLDIEAMDGHVIVKKLGKDGDHGEKRVKIMKKKVQEDK